jgi:DNA-directed RNA polymerase I, II, and III subunit RPABC2
MVALPQRSRNRLIYALSFISFDYEPADNDFDNEPEAYVDEHIDHAEGANGEEQFTKNENGETVIVSGDPNAGPSKNKVMEQPREKKVPNDERSTTPYMTKYERARVLGTRALQIRLVYTKV